MYEKPLRDSYIEKSRTTLLKMSLPHDILNIVERKEQLYKNFSSQELIDIYISQTQAKKSNSTDSMYNVYALSYTNVGVEANMNNQRTKERKIRKINKLGGNDNASSSNQDLHEQKVKDVQREEKGRYDIDIKPEKSTYKTKSKLEELRKLDLKLYRGSALSV